MNTTLHRRTHAFARTSLLTGLLCASLAAQALEDKLVVITSFPKDLTLVYEKAFEAKHPDVQVEILNKKTTAGVKYIQETAGSNTSDLMWASAPDAFEVLKGDGLLSRYQSAAEGIPELVGSYPINDPDGYYLGFAASGYGIMWNTRYLKAKKVPEPAEWSDLARPEYSGHVGMSAPSRSGTTHLTVETVLQKAPEGFPNPFTDSSIGAQVKFDVVKSKARYNLVNSLFDVMITYRLEDLQDATRAIQEAEVALAGKNHAEAQALIDEAKALVAAVPIDEAKAMDPEFAATFKKKRKKKTDQVTGRQAEVEQEWDSLVKANYQRARELAEQAGGMR